MELSRRGLLQRTQHPLLDGGDLLGARGEECTSRRSQRQTQDFPVVGARCSTHKPSRVEGVDNLIRCLGADKRTPSDFSGRRAGARFNDRQGCVLGNRQPSGPHHRLEQGPQLHLESLDEVHRPRTLPHLTLVLTQDAPPLIDPRFSIFIAVSLRSILRDSELQVRTKAARPPSASTIGRLACRFDNFWHYWRRSSVKSIRQFPIFGTGPIGALAKMWSCDGQ